MTITEEGHAIIADDTHIGRWVRESHRLDHDAMVGDLIVPMLKPDWVVVDGGANIGTHTVRYAAAVPNGYVLAFEPNPEAHECLAYNLRDYKNTECYRLGLSDRVGCFQFLRDTNAGGSHLTLAPGNAECIRLDSMHLTRCDFIKLDVEGYELFALRGAFETITVHRPIILTEMNAGTLARVGLGYNDIFEWLSGMGYEWRAFAESCDLLNTPQYDLLATPKTKTA